MGGDGNSLHAWNMAWVRVAGAYISSSIVTASADLFGAEDRPQPQLNLAISPGPWVDQILVAPMDGFFCEALISFTKRKG